MSLDRKKHAETLERFPRVSGDEPVAEQHVDAHGMFSPRERG